MPTSPTLQWGPVAGTTVRKDLSNNNRLIFNINNNDVMTVSDDPCVLGVTGGINITGDYKRNGTKIDIDYVTPTTTFGDLIVEDGTNAVRFDLGTTGYVLSVDTSSATGLKWTSLTSLGNSAITASNIGTGEGVFAQKVVDDLEF